MVHETALTSDEGQAICIDIFATILEGREDLMAEIAEIIEVTTRLLLSLLLLEGPVKRTDKETRAFLERRLLPATVGLT